VLFVTKDAFVRPVDAETAKTAQNASKCIVSHDLVATLWAAKKTVRMSWPWLLPNPVDSQYALRRDVHRAVLVGEDLLDRRATEQHVALVMRETVNGLFELPTRRPCLRGRAIQPGR
jgi:hypothetical protein